MAYSNFQMDAQSSEANFPCPGVRSAFYSILFLYGLIRSHYSLI
jgi:hypothetical protein